MTPSREDPCHAPPRRRALTAAVLAAALGTGLAVPGASVSPASASPADAAAPASATGAPAPAPDPTLDLRDRIARLPGVTSVTEQPAPAEGFRFFTLTFRQPIDHARPRGATFEQRLTLLHRDESRPMVMYTSGYYVSQRASRSEPARIVDGNQLCMEYRFFTPSVPANPDWPRQLTIAQAAADQHAIIASFKGLYRAHWLTTGGSKGGMTATYHRRFYPDDVNGTIPYVAPNDVDNRRDSYGSFLANVGTDPACRDAIVAVQRRILGVDRAWFLDRTTAAAAEQGLTATILGGADAAMESTVIDLSYAFWQYTPQSECVNVPGASATREEVWDWTQAINPLTGGFDQPLSDYTPYYYQAATQLGWPSGYAGPLADLLRHSADTGGAALLPADLRPVRFDRSAMRDIDRWVRTKASQMLYVNGGNDPWSAEPFDCGRRGADRECSVHTVAGGTHGSTIAELPEAERAAATAQVLRWAGLPAQDRALRTMAADARPALIPALDLAPDHARPPGTLPRG